MKKVGKGDVIEANRLVHTRLVEADQYVESSPHFLPENKRRVRETLQREVWPHLNLNEPLAAIDFGCGTGFMFEFLDDYADKIVGVDVTRAMLDRVEFTSDKLSLHIGVAEQTPFQDETFNLATAYSFLDHLEDIETFFLEVFRVLKPGGVFYSGLTPHKKFSRMISEVMNQAPTAKNNPLLAREAIAVADNGQYYESKFGIDRNCLELAEYTKTVFGGLDATTAHSMAKKIGFTSVFTSLEWFLGQAKYSKELKDVTEVREYLDLIAPASDSLYKYINVVCVK